MADPGAAPAPDREADPSSAERAALDAIDDLIRRGALIGAYDRAEACLAAGMDHPRLRYSSVLALARSGATARAAEQYRALGLHRIGDVDSASLWARILKDAAFLSPGPARGRRLERAARGYLRVFRRTGDPYPGINAATLLLLAGRDGEATTLAAALLDETTAAPAANPYYATAIRAEALIILRRWGDAAAALDRARALAGTDYGALSTTRRQLVTLLSARPADPATTRDLLDRLRLPRVAHYAWGEVAPDREAWLAESLARRLAAAEIGFAVGTLWTTGALVAAEQVLARGAELHLVLPFSVADYLKVVGQIRPGPDADRRRLCVEAAISVLAATADGDFSDPALVAYAETVAAGSARIRARRLSTDCVSLSPAGESGGGHAPGAATASAAALPDPDGPVREIRALLFADVYRFSAIPESQLPRFWSRFMGGIAETIDAAGPAVLYRNTWGDALFLVVDEIGAAADLALALQERAARMRARELSGPQIRIGLHHGPVFRGWDPVRGTANYFGTQVSRAARVEPVTPPGAVYVTEPFAAILAGQADERFDTEYVGVVPLPKRYGEHRMYRLGRRWTGGSPGPSDGRWEPEAPGRSRALAAPGGSKEAVPLRRDELKGLGAAPGEGR